MIDTLAPATQQLEWLETEHTTALELLNAHIEAYKRMNPSINAVIATDLNSAKARAVELDTLASQGERVGPLHGLPMTIKDTYDVHGLPAVAGAPGLANRDPNVENADVVERLTEAGAIIWGKTNTPLFAGDVQTYNAVYGVTNNPHDVTRTPGGSSGGSAAALAAGITPLEVGSDIGGSLRTPAHNCGLCTLKPTYGVVSLKGHVPPLPGTDAPDPDLGVAGPMARTMADLILLFSILAPGHERPEALPQSLESCRVAFWNDDTHFEVSEACAVAVKQLAEHARGAGAKVDEARPDFDPDELMDVYQRLLMPIVTADLPARTHSYFRSIRPFARLLRRKGEMSLMNTAISATQSPTEFEKTQARRAILKDLCTDFFRDWDVVLMPVTPVPAIKHNTKAEFYRRRIDVDGQRKPYPVLFKWISLATACHLPSAVIPVAKTTDGLPIGVQIVGAEGTDHKVLAIAKLLEDRVRAESA